MIGLCDEEQRLRPPKRCKDLAAALRDAFADCHRCRGRRVSLSAHDDDDDENDDDAIYDFDYEHAIVVSEIRSRAMEKLRQKPKMMYVDSFSWILSYSTRQDKEEEQEDQEEGENAGSEFLSAVSCFSEYCSLSVVSKEAYLSAKTELSRCTSFNGVDQFENPWKIYRKDQYFRKRSVIQELCHCEGWPFGLGRKAVLLPPLPKSPSESWSWTKRTSVSSNPCV